MSSTPFTLVRLANGAYSLRSTAHGETLHPVIGPVAEAQTLYARQLRLPERMASGAGEFVIWDIGLGAAANAIAALEATQAVARNVRLISFDCTLEPLNFALAHATELGYFAGFQTPLAQLADMRQTVITESNRTIHWELIHADFPSWVASAVKSTTVTRPPAPDAILFDAYSPAKNPAMWSLPLFSHLYATLDPQRPCSLATYSRSTLLRTTLLLAGFFVGRGQATGEKEETTVAANARELIEHPLDARWLARAQASTSAEPLHEDVYRQAPLSPASGEKLCQHPQFAFPTN